MLKLNLLLGADMSMIKMRELFDFSSIPQHDHCVYLLFDDYRDVIYVGQTRNLKTRIYQHILDGKPFSQFECIPCTEDEVTNLEAEYIIKHNPKLNTKLPTVDKYKTITQARNIILEAIKGKEGQVLDFIVDDLEVIFHRPKVKHISFSYVLTEDLDKVAKEIKELFIHYLNNKEFK